MRKIEKENEYFKITKEIELSSSPDINKFLRSWFRIDNGTSLDSQKGIMEVKLSPGSRRGVDIYGNGKNKSFLRNWLFFSWTKTIPTKQSTENLLETNFFTTQQKNGNELIFLEKYMKSEYDYTQIKTGKWVEDFKNFLVGTWTIEDFLYMFLFEFSETSFCMNSKTRVLYIVWHLRRLLPSSIGETINSPRDLNLLVQKITRLLFLKHALKELSTELFYKSDSFVQTKVNLVNQKYSNIKKSIVMEYKKKENKEQRETGILLKELKAKISKIYPIKLLSEKISSDPRLKIETSQFCNKILKLQGECKKEISQSVDANKLERFYKWLELHTAYLLKHAPKEYLEIITSTNSRYNYDGELFQQYLDWEHDFMIEQHDFLNECEFQTKPITPTKGKCSNCFNEGKYTHPSDKWVCEDCYLKVTSKNEKCVHCSNIGEYIDSSGKLICGDCYIKK